MVFIILVLLLDLLQVFMLIILLLEIFLQFFRLFFLDVLNVCIYFVVNGCQPLQVLLVIQFNYPSIFFYNVVLIHLPKKKKRQKMVGSVLLSLCAWDLMATLHTTFRNTQIHVHQGLENTNEMNRFTLLLMRKIVHEIYKIKRSGCK